MRLKHNMQIRKDFWIVTNKIMLQRPFVLRLNSDGKLRGPKYAPTFTMVKPLRVPPGYKAYARLRRMFFREPRKLGVTAMSLNVKLTIRPDQQQRTWGGRTQEVTLNLVPFLSGYLPRDGPHNEILGNLYEILRAVENEITRVLVDRFEGRFLLPGGQTYRYTIAEGMRITQPNVSDLNTQGTFKMLGALVGKAAFNDVITAQNGNCYLDLYYHRDLVEKIELSGPFLRWLDLEPDQVYDFTYGQSRLCRITPSVKYIRVMSNLAADTFSNYTPGGHMVEPDGCLAVVPNNAGNDLLMNGYGFWDNSRDYTTVNGEFIDGVSLIFRDDKGDLLTSMTEYEMEIEIIMRNEELPQMSGDYANTRELMQL
mmetsp:Transcript_25935/g.43139  ORF Transcript_25935/g.43139 Transcript_25935/m.43139 type:complete len:368 (-) Transcript_25935:1235-2338(-)